LLGKQLVKQGHEVKIIASNLHYQSRKNFTVPSESQEIDGILFHWIKSPSYKFGLSRLWNHFVFSIKLIYLLLKLRSNYTPDIVVASSPQPFASFVAALFAFYYKLTLIYEVRDLWPQSLVDLGAISKKNIIYYIFDTIEKFISRRADRVLCLMPGGVEYFRSLGVNGQKIFWSPNGLDYKSLPRVRAETNDDRVDDQFEIGYFGSHGPSDGLEFIIDLANRLKHSGVTFRMVGDGPQKQDLIEKAKSFDLNNILFYAPVPKSSVYFEMVKCDAFIVIALPSPLYRWGISFNKIYDYFFLKKPILFVGNVFRNPVAESNSGIVVRELNLDEAVDAVLRLKALTYAERYKLGLNGYQYGLKNHSIEEISIGFQIGG